MKACRADGGNDEFLYLRFADLLYLPDALSFHPLGEERRGGDGERATRRLEGDVFDDALRINAELEREAVAAQRIRDRGGVGRFLQCAEIQRMPVVLQYLLAVHVVSVAVHTRLVQFRIIPAVVIFQSLCKIAAAPGIFEILFTSFGIDERTTSFIVYEGEGPPRSCGKTFALLVLIHALSQITRVSDVLFTVFRTLKYVDVIKAIRNCPTGHRISFVSREAP